MKVVVAAASVLVLSALAPRAEASVAARQGKTAYVAAEAVGFTLMPVFGGRVGYFINQDLAAEIGYAGATAKVGDFEAGKKLIEAKAKYFLGNSFYIDGGLAYETWSVEYTVPRVGSAFDRSKLSADVASTGMTLHIGNQWQWGGFALGVDWIGYFLSLSSKATFASNADVDQAEKQKEEKSVDETLSGSSPHLMRLYLGWAF